MKSLHLTTHIAADGMLHLPVAAFADQDVDVIVSPVAANPYLIEKLVSLTVIRDLEVFEIVLMKTLYQMFYSEDLFLLKSDHAEDFELILRYVSAGDGTAMFSYRQPLPPEMKSALDIARRLNGFYQTRMLDDGYLSVYLLPATNARLFDICLINKSTQELTAHDKLLIDGFLQIYRNFCLLIDDSQHDQLTGLLNRKNFDENMQNLMALALNLSMTGDAEEDGSQSPAGEGLKKWLGLIDIDHFKTINDTLGHMYGDEVLVLLGKLLRESFQDDDLIYRFGGEEFLVVMDRFSLADARAALERFREQVAGFRFPQIAQVTISCGAVQITSGTLTHTLLDRADQAIYFAKQAGRNQVRFYEDLVASGAIAPVDSRMGDINLF